MTDCFTKQEVIDLIWRHAPESEREKALIWWAGYTAKWSDKDRSSVGFICAYLDKTGMPTCWQDWARKYLVKEEEWPEVGEGTWWQFIEGEYDQPIAIHARDMGLLIHLINKTKQFHPRSSEITVKAFEVYNAWRKLPQDQRDKFLEGTL